MCSKLRWHCLISRDCFKPSQRAAAPTLCSSLSLRVINAAPRYPGHCPSLKKNKHFYSWEQEKFQTSSFFIFFFSEKGIPSCCLLSLCLHHTCACGGQSSSINYSSTIGLASPGCQEQKHLMVCWMSLSAPTVIFNSRQVVDLISSAFKLRLGLRMFCFVLFFFLIACSKINDSRALLLEQLIGVGITLGCLTWGCGFSPWNSLQFPWDLVKFLTPHFCTQQFTQYLPFLGFFYGKKYFKNYQ